MTSTPTLGEYEQTILELLPSQGRWTDADYLWLTDHASRLVEFTDGHIEHLPIPTDQHQSIAELFFLLFTNFLAPIGGKAHLAPLRLQIRPGKYREPDVLL